MRGIAIIAMLLLAVLCALFLLFRPSDTDLRRIEDDIESRLNQADDQLTRATAIFIALRSIRPNLPVIEKDLTALRNLSAKQRSELTDLRSERPGAGAPRQDFLIRRKKGRSSATRLHTATSGLVARLSLIDNFMHTTQPRVQIMKDAFRNLYQQRNEQQQQGHSIDDDLRIKIDYLYREKENILALARGVITTGSKNFQQGQTMAATVAREVERLIADASALAQRLGRS